VINPLSTSLIIATRASKLALWQAHFVRQALLAIAPHLDIHLLEITTQADKTLDRSLAQIGGKGLFIKELEAAIVEGRADLAVHSMKDVPNDLADGLMMGAICEREDPRDVFLSHQYSTWQDLPQNAILGTCSVRRTAQMLHLRPDLQIQVLRGNVDTRLRKLDHYDGIILAAAGLKRLSLESHIKQYFDFKTLLPSVAQGAIGIQCKAADQDLINLLARINHASTALCINTERAFTKQLSGDCDSPIAVYAEIRDNELYIEGLVASLDGKIILRDHLQGELKRNLGVELAECLIEKGAKKILELNQSRDR
jgi:hydroxymethylbilane synthase